MTSRATPAETVPLVLASHSKPTFAAGEGAPGDTPRSDFLEIVRALHADVLYPLAARNALLRAVEAQTASDIGQAWRAFKRRDQTRVYVSLSEKVGVPLGLFLRGAGSKGERVPHVLIAHRLTSSKKRVLQTRLRYLDGFDRIVVLCQAQAQYLTDEAGIAPDKVRCIHDKVDHRFWTPGKNETVAPPCGPVVAVGRERRDVATLLNAARLMPNQAFVIVASSLWIASDRKGGEMCKNVPPNVTFCERLEWTALRDLIRRASVVVVPLLAETDYAAGVNAVLEAMATAKPLVVTQTPGLSDYVRDNQTCRIVPPADAVALRDATTDLLQNPAEAARLGANARRVIESGRNLDTYVEVIKNVVCEVAPC